MKISEYFLKSGEKRYRINAYLGIDETTGKQVNFNRSGFKSDREAKTAYNRAYMKFINDEAITNPKEIKCSELIDEWLASYKNTVRESSYLKITQLIDLYILPNFKDVKVSKVSGAMLQDWVNDLFEKYKIYKYIFSTFSRILEYAVVQGYIEVNPKKRVIVPSARLQENVYEKKSKDFYNVKELNEFMTALESGGHLMWTAFFKILAYTGLRKGEALALTWNDIDLFNKELDVNKAVFAGQTDGKRTIKVGPPKNKSSARIISIDTQTIKSLEKWKLEQTKTLFRLGHRVDSKNQLVFSKLKSNTHLDIAAPRNYLERLCRLNDLEMINVHGFRHTHCSLLFEAGIPMKDVMARLGHSDIKTTMNIYTHVTDQSKERTADKFERYLNLP